MLINVILLTKCCHATVSDNVCDECFKDCETFMQDKDRDYDPQNKIDYDEFKAGEKNAFGGSKHNRSE